ncbi:Protein of unknown function [Propionibacterium freudenreichii]|uniref:Uncharacterized protein n=1 Tax=Propionibacterium freudenreichii subsp. freudenreichii TaxID=66712 RepID=A0A068VNU8_PROFF|nr:Protein of unknown function [Propionibacterium freudenreichii subsp. freudenreichii]CEG87035.1 Protein of unknown function [Propionibacterium freudenreichii]CEG89035.1 Protein of unknown function [Propionibacterium freudenreichii]CEG94242.1 Protein of unknown function [Propionibacterium freudenreichii]CEG99323.1 Protein of unknown function [Propionibacterium freudenreichii]
MTNDTLMFGDHDQQCSVAM